MTEELEALWQSLPLEGKSPQEQAELLNKAAAGALHYVPGITGLSTTAGQALVLGSGVCQDYAHILLALARRSGFAARYCMGLVPGEGATHAWVEIALPDGWHGYDPTFSCEAGEDHVRFAVGRDAADCQQQHIPPANGGRPQQMGKSQDHRWHSAGKTIPLPSGGRSRGTVFRQRERSNPRSDTRYPGQKPSHPLPCFHRPRRRIYGKNQYSACCQFRHG